MRTNGAARPGRVRKASPPLPHPQCLVDSLRIPIAPHTSAATPTFPDRYPRRSSTTLTPTLTLTLTPTRHPRPTYKRWWAILYGSFIDWAILLRVPLGDNIFGCIARHRGPEQIRLLLVLALFDAEGDGEISEIELEKFDHLSDQIISDGKDTCVNLSIVSVILLGLLHNVTIGRPVAFAFGAGAEEQYGSWLLWLAYGLNLSGESGAFFTMCLSIITRNYLTNVLPTRHDKVDFLRTTNALGCMGSSMLITMWCFLLSSIFLALTTNPTLGLLGAGILLVLLFAFMFFIAPLRYCGTMLLHEEVVHVLMKREEKRRSRASSYASSRAGSVPPSPSRPPPPSRPPSLSGGSAVFFRPGMLAASGQASGRISHSGSALAPWNASQGSADASPKFAHPPSSGMGRALPCWTTQPPTPFQARQSRVSGVSTESDTEHQDAENDLHEVVVM